MINQRQIDYATTYKYSFEENNQEVARGLLYVLKDDAHKEPFGLMSDIHVKSKYREKGYGTKIVKHIIQQAKDKGCYKLMLSSKESRGLESWYLNLGFKKHSTTYRINLK